MLVQAKKKVDQGAFKNSIKLIHSDIAHIADLKSDSVDYIISTYNPLSFCLEPQEVINEAFRILKKGGTAQITIQGYYNALYSKVNNFLAPAEEIKTIFEEKKVQWTPDVPKLWQLSKDDMKQLFRKSGFSSIFSRGIACIIQPQSEDFDPENKKVGSLSKQLATPEFFQTLFEIEHKVGATDSVVDRAMNILTIGTK
jgi:ubiquinone/menaquinone biosynthesis C-methylase UbiE